ncbi:hypothetical protein DHEL01_v208593 [Diaporthe helianthi]|uniref:Uncharacterized protein n=1 Tax=Diaporthe helianthi TaxID=158607 RepID=A0A2P5HRX0_DIAHE|nr:hypothetical protein DHEL01_v208593 [Diaporthe helianthi]
MRFTLFALLPFLACSAVEASIIGHSEGPSPGGPGHRRFAAPEPAPRSGPSLRGAGHRRDAADIDQLD